MINDQSATLQTSKVTGDARHGHTIGMDHPDHPRARARGWSTPRTWVVCCRSWQWRPQSNYIDGNSW